MNKIIINNQTNDAKKALTFLTIFCIIFGSIFFFVGFGIFSSQNKLKKLCVASVEAEVIALDTNGSSSSSSSAYYPVFRFTYNGNTYTVKSSAGSSPPQFDKGEITELMINPDKPEQFIASHDNTLAIIYTVFMIIGGLFIALGIAVPAAARYKIRRQEERESGHFDI